MSEAHFRVASPEDYLRISEIFNENIEAADATLWQRHFTVDDIAALDTSLASGEQLYVIELAQEVVGFGMVKKYSPKWGYHRTCETSLFLDRAFRRRGLGTSFKKYLLGECQSLGYHHVLARILADNEASIQYNLKIGYTLVGIQKEIGYREGGYVDVAIMQYIIEQ